MTKFYDTCALLEAQDEAFNDVFFISDVTLRELEDIKVSSKKDEAVKFKARNVTRALQEHENDYQIICFRTVKSQYDIVDELSNDEKIVLCAKYVSEYFTDVDDLIFITNDICLYNIAHNIYELDCDVYKPDNADEYKGYIELRLNENETLYFYDHLDENPYGVLINQYVLLEDEEGNVLDKLKWTGETFEVIKSLSFRSLEMDGAIKPLDDIQAFAFDAVKNTDVTVLYGRAGSGKTSIPLEYAMQEVDKGKRNRLYIIYSYEPLRGARTLGYEKGDHITKLLYYSSVGNILATKFGDMQEVERLIEDGKIEIIPTANLRGVEFSKDSIVLCTEAQNLDAYTVKTIVQRCKDGCKLILEGDILEQKDVNITNSGINRLIEVFKGTDVFSCIKLKYNYRSSVIGELADKL